MEAEKKPDPTNSLRCVLAATGGGPRTVFAQEPGNRDGRLIHIDDAPNGKTGLVCPDCLHEVVARHGEKRRHSFAHWKGGDCVFAGETAVHRLAKDIIAQRGHLLIPAIEIFDVGGKKQLNPATTMSFDEVLVERYAGTQRPDLIGIVTDRYGEEHRLMIEIHVTNPVYGRRKRKLALQKHTVMEIDLSKIDRDIDEEALAAAVLRDAPRKWVTHLRRDTLQKEADERLKKEEEDRKRRQSHAIMEREQRDIARTQSLVIPARVPEGKEADQAIRDLALWRAIEFQDVILVVSAQDAIFTVPPEFWRARVMSVFAPWDVYAEFQERDFLKIASAAARDLKALGWVKKAYFSVEKDFTGRGFRERDFVEDACAALLENVAAASSGKTSGAQALTLTNAIRAKWEAFKEARSSILALSEALHAYGAKLYHGGRHLDDLAAVEDYLVNAGAQGVRPPASYFDGLLWELNHGHPRYGRRTDVRMMERMGIRPVSDEGEVLDLGGLMIAASCDKAQVLQRQIDTRVKEALQKCLAYFRKLEDEWPGLRDILNRSMVGELRRLQDKAPGFEIKIDMDLSRPEKSAEEQLARALRPARRLAKDLARAVAFSESAGDQATREWVFYTCARMAAASSDSKSALPGLERETDFTAINALMRTLQEKSHKHGYGADFQRRALGSPPPGEDRPLLEVILAGERMSYLKALADIRQRSFPSPWISSIL